MSKASKAPILPTLTGKTITFSSDIVFDAAGKAMLKVVPGDIINIKNESFIVLETKPVRGGYGAMALCVTTEYDNRLYHVINGKVHGAIQLGWSGGCNVDVADATAGFVNW